MKKLVLSAVFLFSFLGLSAQNYQLHSVFMYSFARYIQWPDDASSGDFSIIVLGDSPILTELNSLATKKKIGDRTISVTRIASADAIRKCNILFVSSDQSSHLSEVIGKVGDNATLIVTEQAGLGSKGSNINFIIKDGKLAFELNSNAFGKRKLKPSSELTRLAILI